MRSTLEPERGNARGGKMEAIKAALVADLHSIRTQSPLVLNITNLVAMDFTANALLALGASPVMSQAIEEIPELVALSNSVVINMGTIDERFISLAQHSLKVAGDLGKPVIFDPVGAGASQYRTNTAKGLILSKAISVVRGNASEISALFGSHAKTKGVDSTLSPSAVAGDIRAKSKETQAVIAVSGETDYIFSNKEVITSSHGCSLMAKVTGMGCTASSLLAAFLAVSATPIQAALHSTIVMGIAGEIAKKRAVGPGSFRLEFIDALSKIQPTDFANLKVQFR